MKVITTPNFILKGSKGELLAKYGKDKLFIDYDEEADVLYVSFGKPQKADDSIHGEDDIIRRKKDNKIIGLTILNASRFRKVKSN